jgi:hypothetical protein
LLHITTFINQLAGRKLAVIYIEGTCEEAYDRTFTALFNAICEHTGKELSCTLWDSSANFDSWSVNGDVAHLKGLEIVIQKQMQKFFKMGDDVPEHLLKLINNENPIPCALCCAQGCQIHHGRYDFLCIQSDRSLRNLQEHT